MGEDTPQSLQCATVPAPVTCPLWKTCHHARRQMNTATSDATRESRYRRPQDLRKTKEGDVRVLVVALTDVPAQWGLVGIAASCLLF